MSTVGQAEIVTQKRIIKLFQEELGYTYLGDWHSRANNSNIEADLLTASLTKRGYRPAQIGRAMDKLRTEADHPGRNLYANNQAVYALLRYGVQVQVSPSEPTETVHLIDWRDPTANDFAIAEEVTLKRDGGAARRPDLVLYLNGIAVGVVELKNSRVSIGDGIRQHNSNQRPEFNAWFFATVQILFAGSDSEGLKYGTVGTPEKFYLRWKEDVADDSRLRVDKYLLKMCDKARLLELMHDFVLFDGGAKKLPRVHQYFGIKAAQRHVDAYEGGIIWHTQGSGKSIVMVLLAKWILENKPNARVAVVTDRDELDKQIEGVFAATGEPIKRSRSGRELLAQLSQAEPRLLCSLVHKFGKKDVEDFEAYIKELKDRPSQTVGDIFVFVDECHRTQSGKLHRTMKALMPNAVFIGFTGTPLLKADTKSSLEVFGRYIHTYLFSEAVEDEVVLDLVYEARDIEQKLGSKAHIDLWFDAKTKALKNDWQRAELRQRWGTMQKVLSSKSRMSRVVQDVVLDFSTKPRLSNDRGTALRVAASIYEACRYFRLFNLTELKGKCAVITSYNPQSQDATLEDTGANTETARSFVYELYKELMADVSAQGDRSKTETYEDNAKRLFREQPTNMKLLIVVDKLLTGFDAPSCTYLYIDKSMQDHGLFQAICRTNRLDGDDKDFGYIVDYKDLFKKVEKALAVYTSELAREEGQREPEIVLKDRLALGRERLEEAREAMDRLYDPVEMPRGLQENIRYFCGNPELADDLASTATRRSGLYKGVAKLVRAFARIADDLEAAGYSDADIMLIKGEVHQAVALRQEIRTGSGETLDLKAYEADMRYLIDTYIEADPAHKTSNFGGMGLLDVIVKSGIAEAIANLPPSIKKTPGSISETIANNVRSRIMKAHLNDPAYYDKMSALLAQILDDLREERLDYEAYLEKIAALAKQVQAGQDDDTPSAINTPGRRALFNNSNKDEQLTLRVDRAVKDKRPDGWRGVRTREMVVKRTLFEVLGGVAEAERIYLIIAQHEEY